MSAETEFDMDDVVDYEKREGEQEDIDEIERTAELDFEVARTRILNDMIPDEDGEFAGETENEEETNAKKP